jgi:hypothetical protein
MEETLEELALTVGALAGRDPDVAEIAAAAVGWAEATLGYLHRLTCEDPLTGLASLAHLQARVVELHRETDCVVPLGSRHALVVLEPAPGPPGTSPGSLDRSLTLARLGATARRVFPGQEVVAGLGGRVVVLAGRSGLDVRVRAVRDLLRCGPTPTRVWVEGLPDGRTAAGALLDELARG